MEEVIAKRNVGSGVSYILVIIMGVTLIAVGVVLGDEAGALVLGAATGAIVLAMGIFYTVRFFMLPKNMVVLRDGVLYFPRKLTCRPEELEKVIIKIYRGRGWFLSRHGKIEVTVRGRVYKYNDVAEIQTAKSRLLELKSLAETQLRQKGRHEAEAQYAEDPFKEFK